MKCRYMYAPSRFNKLHMNLKHELIFSHKYLYNENVLLINETFVN